MWAVMILLLIELSLAILFVFFFRRSSYDMVARIKRRMEEMEGSISTRRNTLHQREEENAQLERQVSEIVELYELTKKVSTSLEFREVFAILRQVLNANFFFEKGHFFLLREGDEGVNPSQRVEEIYTLTPSVKAPSEEEALVKVGASEIPYFGEVIDEAGKRKEAFQGRSFPFTAVPLWVKDRLIAIFVCEQLRSEDIEKLSILSRQFTLVIQKVKLYGKLQELAITDGLTRLYNRRYFLERFQEELARSIRHRLSLSFLMADIDHFKQKNDQYGHLVGDVILREVGALLKANVREIDLVGRYGGEEFSIALSDTRITEALQVAERIRKAVDQKNFTAYDEVMQVTLSIGVGAYPEDGEEAVDLIEAADSALYHAKEAGRNRIATRTRS